MDLFCYSIFDRASQLFGEPFVCVNDNVAQRKFMAICQGAKIMAPDLQLYKLGSFNQQTGDIIMAKEFIAGGVVAPDKVGD